MDNKTQTKSEFEHVLCHLENTFNRRNRRGDDCISEGDSMLPGGSEIFRQVMKELRKEEKAQKICCRTKDNSVRTESDSAKCLNAPSAQDESYRSCSRYPWICVATTANTTTYHVPKYEITDDRPPELHVNSSALV